MAALTEETLYPLVAESVERYGIANLVETGTGPESSGLQVARRLGLRGYSCDVSGPTVKAAKERFPYAQIYHCESLGFLAQVLPTLEEATFFWLDAHGPDFPVFEELLCIKILKNNYQNDVLWLDDFDKPDHLGNHTLQEYIQLLANTHTKALVDGILQCVPRG